MYILLKILRATLQNLIDVRNIGVYTMTTY
jgi:hypothetical protein